VKPSTRKLAGMEAVSNSRVVDTPACMNRWAPFKKSLGTDATDGQQEGVDNAASRKVVSS
jgi:hypothetical protein